MKRRTFGLLTGTSMLALMGSERHSFAASADPSLLKTTLTPMGAERAGNAAGTIPEWTGGMTEVPAGITWDPSSTLPPDFYAGDAMLYEVNSSNLAQYADLVPEGVAYMIKNYGYSLKVFPTHRTAAAPQWVYDNIALNVGRATINSDPRLGFGGAFNGYPFPIPDTSQPLVAGAQVIYNHSARWSGEYFTINIATYTMANNSLVLVSGGTDNYKFPLYEKDGDASAYSGYLYQVYTRVFTPATTAGELNLTYDSANPLTQPTLDWQLLTGQGRVRKAPEVQYDTPSSFADGICNYDEYFAFNGALDRYDWKFIAKKEMLIPYNNNKLINSRPIDAHLPKFLSPDVVRWELHRVWVVEATLHPGERNVLARRLCYVDEDTWIIAIVDAWDAGGNLFHTNHQFNAVFPNLPGTIIANNAVYNLQVGQYVSLLGPWGIPPYNKPVSFEPFAQSVLSPQVMAASASY